MSFWVCVQVFNIVAAVCCNWFSITVHEANCAPCVQNQGYNNWFILESLFTFFCWIQQYIPVEIPPQVIFFSPGNKNGEHSYPEKQGPCSCSYSHHEWPHQLSGGSVTWLFHVRVLCSVIHLLLATRGQTSGTPRALNWVDSQGRHMRESEWRACPKLSNPTPHYCLQSDHIFHLANPSHASIIRAFFHFPLTHLKLSENLPVMTVKKNLPNFYIVLVSAHMFLYH